MTSINQIVFSSILTFCLLLIVYGISTMFIALYFRDKKNDIVKTYSFYSQINAIFGSIILNAFGCLCFRILRRNTTVMHIIVHALALLLMLWGVRAPLNDKPQNNNYYRRNCGILLGLGVYIAQFVLSFHFIFIRHVVSPLWQSINTGVHATFGVLNYFSSCIFGLLVWQKIMVESGGDFESSFYRPFFSLLLFSVCVWFLLLWPSFDWRLMQMEAEEEGD